MTTRRAGFTLVELMVALVIFVLVAASLYRVLNVSQRTARTQTEKAAMQGSLRSGLQIALAEIQEIWSDEGVGSIAGAGSAISAMTSTSLTYEAMRGLGMSCAPMTITTITIRESTWRGLMLPAAGQGIYIFDQGLLGAVTTDDIWHDRVISGVAAGTCTGGGGAYVLTLSVPVVTATIMVPGPVRTHEPMQLGLVASGGRNWLGIAAGGALTPLAGPLRSSGTALSLEYKDKAGATTTTSANVKSIILRLYGETDRMTTQNIGGTPTLLQDSMIVRVQLRNGR
jgi:prepilin-type N-terminal cleavage/methylation domain-containing protein